MGFDLCIVRAITVVVLFIVKFVGEFSLLFVCSGLHVCRPQEAVSLGSVVSVLG